MTHWRDLRLPARSRRHLAHACDAQLVRVHATYRHLHPAVVSLVDLASSPHTVTHLILMRRRHHCEAGPQLGLAIAIGRRQRARTRKVFANKNGGVDMLGVRMMMYKLLATKREHWGKSANCCSAGSVAKMGSREQRAAEFVDVARCAHASMLVLQHGGGGGSRSPTAVAREQAKKNKNKAQVSKLKQGGGAGGAAVVSSCCSPHLS